MAEQTPIYVKGTGAGRKFKKLQSSDSIPVANVPPLPQSKITNLTTDLGNKADLVGGKVPSSQLPSYVDDVEEYANLAAFPVTGSTGKIYTALDTNKIYRWSGSGYVEISPSPGSTDSVTEGATNKYFTESRVLATVLAGLSTATNAAITTADSVLSALGKLQKQITDWIAAKDASGGYAGLTLFKINFRNVANSFTSFFTNSNTAVRTYTFQDRDGIIADDTDLAARALNSPAVTVISTTSYTVQASDNGKVLKTTNSSATTITVPASLGASFNCGWIQEGTGQITFSTSSTTINSYQSYLKSAGQHAAGTLFATASNVFNLSGALAS